jgi:hypothetical protein
MPDPTWPDEKAIFAAVEAMRGQAMREDWSPRSAAVAGLTAAAKASPVIPAPRCELCGGDGKGRGRGGAVRDYPCVDCHGTGVAEVKATAVRAALDAVMQTHSVEGRIGFYSSLLDDLTEAVLNA